MPNLRKIEAAVPAIREKKKVAAYARVSMQSERMLHSLSAQVSYYSGLSPEEPGLGVCRGLRRRFYFRHQHSKTR